MKALFFIVGSHMNMTPWYGYMFLGLAIVIMFPDEALENVHLGFSWRNLIWLEVIFIGIILVAMIVLKRYYLNLRWFSPLIPLSFVAVIRGIIWFFNRSDDGL
jgi:hypothetical protein